MFPGIPEVMFFVDIGCWDFYSIYGDKYSGLVLCKGGLAYFYKGRIHREDGPAVYWGSGFVEWRRNGFGYSFLDFFESASQEVKEKLIWGMDSWKS